MSFSYANPASGPSAGGIGWFNFGNLTLNPGDTLTGLTGTLNDGSTVTFDITATNTAGAPRTFKAVPTPTWSGTFFGNGNYTGILGNVALATQIVFLPGTNGITLSNIVVKDVNNNIIPNYTVLVGDAESTGVGESWTWNTNGGTWELFATLGTSSSPTLTGIGTQTASFTGNNPTANQNDYVLSTQSPSQLVLNTTTLGTGGGSEAIVIGFATTKVTIQKDVGQRIDPSDQFVLNIGGTPNDQVTTTGSADGIQTEIATVFGIPGNTYSINEAMAPGSASVLTDYTVVVSAVNNTPAGSIPPTGNLPINFTPALGDDVIYTIINAAPETFTKTVDKTNADIGDVLTYTVTINNPNSFTISNVLMTDATPAGTTYIGNLVVSAPYTGTAPSTGITITSIGSDDAVTVSWQVQVNTTPPIPNPVTNLASVLVPGGTSGITNVVTTQVKHAFVSIIKSADKLFANVGDTLTYTVTLNNAGNVAANNVVVTDLLPAGTTYVPGSVTSTVPFSGDPTTSITLTAPIAAGGTATITFKAKIQSSVPTTNPLPNTAVVKYAYTVDPAKPNGVSASHASNTVNTLVSNANLTTVKKADKTIAYIGDIITYQIAITNSGNVPANNVIITDPIPNGTIYVPGSLTVSVPYTGSPMTTIHLTNPIAPGQTVSISFQVQVTAIPNPNPIVNIATTDYTYTVNPGLPDGVSASSKSSPVSTLVFRNNFSQEISDLIYSIALEEAAIAAIANAEGAKIQKIVAMSNVTPNELICLNKSIADMIEALGTLESVLKQKLSSVDCQINPTCM